MGLKGNSGGPRGWEGVSSLAEVLQNGPSWHSDVRLVVRRRRVDRNQCPFVQAPDNALDRRQPSEAAALDRVARQRSARRQGAGVLRTRDLDLRHRLRRFRTGPPELLPLPL